MITILDLHTECKQKTAIEYSSHCPACGGEDRFIIHTDKLETDRGRYWCRQCGVKGDAIDYLKEFCGQSYFEACHTLNIVCKDKYLNSNKNNYSSPTTSKTLSKFKNSVTFAPENKTKPNSLEIWQATAKEYAQLFDTGLASDDAKNYLKHRCIDLDFVKTLGLGWNEKDLYLPAEDWGIYNANNQLYIPKGLIIANRRKGGICAINVRKMNNEGHKYHIVKGSVSLSFCLGNPGQPTFIVESELDACLLYQEALKLEKYIYVVATGGATKAFDDYALNEIKKSQKIILVPDNPEIDVAGKKALEKWVKELDVYKIMKTDTAKDLGEMQQKAVETNGEKSPFIADWLKYVLKCK